MTLFKKIRWVILGLCFVLFAHTGCSSDRVGEGVPDEDISLGNFVHADGWTGGDAGGDVTSLTDINPDAESDVLAEDVDEGDDVWFDLCLEIKCDDGNPCTTDDCVEGSCVFTFADTGCEDGDACTVGDTCSGGVCISGPTAECTDDSPCTEDTCLPDVGCIFESLSDGTQCDDGDPCNGGDACSEGDCVPSGDEAPCDDGNPCTVDGCDDIHGCTHNPADLEQCRPQIVVQEPVRAAQIVMDPDGPMEIVIVGSVTAGDGGISQALLNGDVIALGEDGNFSHIMQASIGGNTIEIIAMDGVGHVQNHVQAFQFAKEFLYPKDLSPGTGKVPCEGSESDGFCYQAYASTGITWEAAQAICIGWSGDLASIHSGEENEWIRDLADAACGPMPTWIGLNDMGIEGAYQWTDGTFFEFDNWGEGEPNNFADEDATEMLWNGFWNDRSVQQNLGCYVCKREIVEFSPQYEGAADPGMGLYIAQDAVDDLDHSLPVDDLATVFEISFNEMDFEEWIPSPAVEDAQVDSGTYDIYLEDLSHEAPVVTLICIEGGIALSAVIPSGHADFEAYKTNSALFLPDDVVGDLYFNAIYIETDLIPTVTVGHQISVDLQNESVEIQGVYVEVDESGWGSGAIADTINESLGDFTNSIELTLASQLQGMIGTNVEEALSALAVKSEMTVGPLAEDGSGVFVDLATDFSSVDFKVPGAMVSLRSVAFTDETQVSYASLGAPARDGCGLGTEASFAPIIGMGEDPEAVPPPVEVILTDDAVNLILHSGWLGGLLEFPETDSLLGGMDLEGLGISNLEASVSGLLSPVLSDCSSSGIPSVHVGDLQIVMTMDFFGTPMDVEVYTSFRLGFAFHLIDGVVSYGLGEVLAYQQQVRILQEDMIGYEPLFDVMIEETLKNNLFADGTLSVLGSFPLPSVDLGEVLTGEDAILLNLNATSVKRAAGRTHIGASLGQ